MGFCYSGINAKIKAMSGRLLKYDDYYNLLQLRSVEEIGYRLKEYPTYANVISGIDTGGLRRASIEQKILLSVSEEFKRIYSFISDQYLRSYLDAVFMHNEISMIKFLLCAIYDERDIEYTLPDLQAILGNRLKIDIDKLVGSKTVDELVENLKGTEFHNVLSKRQDDKQPSLFDLEMGLDLYYYMHIWSLQSKHLDDNNKKAMSHINGTEIDLRNIQWIYRLKTYYKINDTRIYTYLIPIRYRLSKVQISRMVEAKSAEDLKNEIDSTPYGKYFTDDTSLERGFYEAMNKAYRKSQRSNPNSIATATSYIHFKELEIKNIISLIEGVRYGLKQDEVLEFMVIADRSKTSTGKEVK